MQTSQEQMLPIIWRMPNDLNIVINSKFIRDLGQIIIYLFSFT